MLKRVRSVVTVKCVEVRDRHFEHFLESFVTLELKDEEEISHTVYRADIVRHILELFYATNSCRLFLYAVQKSYFPWLIWKFKYQLISSKHT